VGAPDDSFILETEALLPRSPAINTGVIASTPATDERGLDRSVNGIIDVGAYEIQQNDIVGRVSESGQLWVGASSGSSFSTSLWATWNPNVTWVDVVTGDFLPAAYASVSLGRGVAASSGHRGRCFTSSTAPGATAWHIIGFPTRP
jgi:hypothetical protein